VVVVSVGDLLALDIDTMRFVLVASVVAGALLYARFGVTAAGTLTAAYVVLLVLAGGWSTLLGIAAVTAVSHLLVRVVITRWFALPKPWLFIGFVAVSSILTAVLVVGFRITGPVSLPGSVQILVVVGSFVTPGLIAYDLASQGPRDTASAFALVVGGTLALTVPVLALANVLTPESSTVTVEAAGRIPDGLFWLAAVASVAIAGALRLSFGLHVAGFLGAVFLVEFLTLEAFVTVILSATAAHLACGVLRDHLVLTPRQRFHVEFLFGALVAWFGLYWGSRVGWLPAEQANRYALEPLLVVGLLATDMGRARSGPARSVLGLVLATAFVSVVLVLADGGTPASVTSAAALLIVGTGILVTPAVRRLRASWRNAVELGLAITDPEPSSPV
jgi:hypothetical protein